MERTYGEKYGSVGTFPLDPCTMAVYSGAVSGKPHRSTKARRASSEHSDVMPRASVSFPPEVYRGLEDLAAKKKVSIAWVVRDAVEKYLVEQFPLFGSGLLKEVQ